MISNDSFDQAIDPGLIEALRKEPFDSDWKRAVANFHERLKKARDEVEQKRRDMEAAFEDASRQPFPPEGLAQIAEKALEERRATAEKVYPGINALQELIELVRKNSSKLPEIDIAADLEEGLRVGYAHLEVWDSFRQKLLDLAAARQAASGEVLRARPLKGKVDHEALSREFMARFPEIRAALAK